MSCHLPSPPEILFVSLQVPLLPRPNPAPAPEGRSHWDLESFLNLGLRQSAQIKYFGSRLQVAGAWPPEAVRCQGIAGSPSGRQEVRGLKIRPLGQDSGEQGTWSSLSREAKQKHFLESPLGDLGDCLFHLHPGP